MWLCSVVAVSCPSLPLAPPPCPAPCPLGSLSAWFRIKYPHLVVGAIATSAPVEAKLNFVEYLEVVRDSLNTTQHGAECVSAVKMANEQLTTLLKNKASWPVVEKMFK